MNIKESALFKIKTEVFDDKFNIEELHFYKLNLALDHDHLSVFVYNTKNNRALILEKYYFETNNTVEVLEAIFNGHSYINAGFWKEIKVIFKTKNFTFLPNAIFDLEQKENYLKLCTDYNSLTESILIKKHQKLSLTTTFSIDNDLVEFFKNKYPSKEIKIGTHIDTFIDLITNEPIDNDDNSLFILAQDNKISIVKFKKQELQYANTFDYKSSEDLTYYSMLVINELGLNPDIINITMWGNMDISSIYFKRLSEYVKNIELGPRNEKIHFGFSFDEVYEHDYYDLIGSNL